MSGIAEVKVQYCQHLEQWLDSNLFVPLPAVFDHEPHSEVYHAVGVLTAGWRQICEVGVKVLATLRTVVLRIGDDEIAWTPEVEIAQGFCRKVAFSRVWESV